MKEIFNTHEYLIKDTVLGTISSIVYIIIPISYMLKIGLFMYIFIFLYLVRLRMSMLINPKYKIIWMKSNKFLVEFSDFRVSLQTITEHRYLFGIY